jgi:hypothetical protein
VLDWVELEAKATGEMQAGKPEADPMGEI